VESIGAYSDFPICTWSGRWLSVTGRKPGQWTRTRKSRFIAVPFCEKNYTSQGRTCQTLQFSFHENQIFVTGQLAIVFNLIFADLRFSVAQQRRGLRFSLIC
jgi:hypothetical protein